MGWNNQEEFDELVKTPPGKLTDDDLPIYSYPEIAGQADYYCGYCDDFESDDRDKVVEHIRQGCKYAPK